MFLRGKRSRENMLTIVNPLKFRRTSEVLATLPKTHALRLSREFGQLAELNKTVREVSIQFGQLYEFNNTLNRTKFYCVIRRTRKAFTGNIHR